MGDRWMNPKALRWGLFMVLCLLCCPTLTAQCGCDTATTWEVAHAKANVVFLGTCVDVNPNTIKGGLNVVFQVDSSWKREIEPYATVHTTSPNQCGYPFQRGRKYIVFARKRHQTIETSECEPNQAYEDNALLTLHRLGQGYPPGRAGMAAKMSLILAALGALGLLFLAFVVLRKRIRKQKAVN